MRGVVILFLVAVLSLASVFALTTDDSYIYPGEPFSFTSCDPLAQISVTCLNATKLSSARLSSECTVYSFAEEDLSCAFPRITANSSKSNESVVLRRIDYETLLDQRLSSQTTDDPVRLAQFIHGQVVRSGSYDAQLLETLKLIRDEDLKCWPRDDCDLEVTTDVAFYLAQAGLNRTSRVYNDALLYIEGKQTPTTAIEWEIEFDAREDVTCTLNYDEGSQIASETIPEDDDDIKIEFDYDVGELMNMTCTNDFCARITNEFGDQQFRGCEEDDEYLFFRMEGGCFYRENVRSCSMPLTAKIISLTGLDEEVYDAAVEWVETDLERITTGGQHLLTTDEVETNAYVFPHFDDEDLISWVLFSQNNDGSFGPGTVDQKVLRTLEIIDVLYNGTSLHREWILDATSWLSESFGAHRTVFSLPSLIFGYDLYERQQNITFSDSLLADEGSLLQTTITTDMPLTFSLETRYSTINLSTISRDGFYELNISQPFTLGTFSGNVSIRSPFTTYTLPFVFLNEPYFQLTNQPVTLYTSSGFLNLSFEKSSEDFLCDFSFSDYFLPLSQAITSERTLTVHYEDLDTFATKTVSLLARCQVGEYYFEETSSLEVTSVPIAPFTLAVLPSTYSGQPVQLSNQLDKTITVDIQSLSEQFSPYTVALAVGETKELLFFEGLETGQDVLQFDYDSYTYSQELRFLRPDLLSTQLIIILASAIFLIAVAVAVFVLYRHRKKKKLQQETSSDEENGQDVETRNKKDSDSTAGSATQNSSQSSVQAQDTHHKKRKLLKLISEASAQARGDGSSKETDSSQKNSSQKPSLPTKDSSSQASTAKTEQKQEAAAPAEPSWFFVPYKDFHRRYFVRQFSQSVDILSSFGEQTTRRLRDTFLTSVLYAFDSFLGTNSTQDVLNKEGYTQENFSELKEKTELDKKVSDLASNFTYVPPKADDEPAQADELDTTDTKK